MTYTILNIVFLAIFLFILKPKKTELKSLGQILLILVILTTIFDNLIIAAGIVDYDPEKILGLKIGVAPIEDFFYTILVVIGATAMFNRYENS